MSDPAVNLDLPVSPEGLGHLLQVRKLFFSVHTGHEAQR